MKLHKQLPDHSNSHVLIVGTFDGLHRGHQHLIEQARDSARRKNEPLGVMTFHPDPEMVLSGANPRDRQLMTRVDKLVLLDRYGVDQLYEISFDKEFSRTSPREFIRKYLVESLTLSEVCVGRDFRFGRGRNGDPELLNRVLSNHGIDLRTVDPLSFDDSPVSSSIIRTLIERGAVKEARELLGRPYVTFETVVEGEGRGREIGFPTLNFLLEKTIHPEHGVYAGWLEDDTLYRSVINFGLRPTVNDADSRPVLEVHCLDGDPGVEHGESAHVHFEENIRDEREFHNLDALKDQISDDTKEAERILERGCTPDKIGTKSSRIIESR